MADKKYLDQNPPLENRIAKTHDSETEPEFKEQNLADLQTDECNLIAHKLHTSAKVYDKVKTYPKLVDPFIKFFNTLKKRTNGPEPRILWTRVGEDTTVFDPQGSVVGIKCTYALTEQEEVSDDISLPDEIEPPREELFIEEISLPPSVVDTDLVLCHVILNKIEKLEPYVMTSEDEDEDDGRLTYHRRGRLLICLP
ncbi:unnamed protein product [Brassica oleracea]|uniref:(rape) hypothetical protein n=1 Tax=Brassica napus TaxID=3708 RepID=A0A816L7D7_BRANA|nr:unnamed protein product [Brassica napus]